MSQWASTHIIVDLEQGTLLVSRGRFCLQTKLNRMQPSLQFLKLHLWFPCFDKSSSASVLMADGNVTGFAGLRLELSITTDIQNHSDSQGYDSVWSDTSAALKNTLLLITFCCFFYLNIYHENSAVILWFEIWKSSLHVSTKCHGEQIKNSFHFTVHVRWKTWS